MARAKEKPKKNIVLGSQDLAKKYPGSGVAASIVLPRENLIWIPSRCIPLNYAMGGGTPYGHICENFGEESSGKTLAALDFGYSTLSLGGEIIFNDAQQSFTADWAEKNGLNLKKIHLYNSTSVEYVSDKAYRLNTLQVQGLRLVMPKQWLYTETELTFITVKLR